MNFFRKVITIEIPQTFTTSQDALVTWFDCMEALLSRNLYELEDKSHENNPLSHKHPWWKLKKTITIILQRLFSK